MRALQKFGIAVGILWTAAVAICWLGLSVLMLASSQSQDQAWMVIAVATVVGVLAVRAGWFIVALRVWVFE